MSRISSISMSATSQSSDAAVALGMPLPPVAEKIGESSSESTNGKPKVVILGSGWGGFNFGNQVSKDIYDVTLVSPTNHFLFTPLLTSTTVGTLEYNAI